MIPVEIYTKVYYTILSCLVVFSILPLLKYKDLAYFPKVNLKLGSFLLLITTISFIGLRDPWGSWKYFGDTTAYSVMYEEINYSNLLEAKDIGFTFLMYICKPFLNHQLFFLLCALLYVGFIYFFSKKIISKYSFFLFIMFITSMSFWSFGINGVRNGIATSLFLFALVYRQNKKFMLFLLFVSISFHKSMLLPVIAFLLTYYFQNTKILVRIWLFSIVVSYFFGDFLETYISNLLSENTFEDSRFMTFTSNSGIDLEVSTRSFRMDFILYSSIPIILGYFYRFKRNFEDLFYNQLLNTYLISNTIWILLIFSSFTNRTAYLSWFLMPIVLVYPLLKQKDLVRNKSLFLALLIFGSLTFTLLIYSKS